LNFFEGQESVSFDVLKTVSQFVSGYEVDACPLKLWEDAILSYKPFHLKTHLIRMRTSAQFMTRPMRHNEEARFYAACSTSPLRMKLMRFG
jgi:hypothetical protein